MSSQTSHQAADHVKRLTALQAAATSTRGVEYLARGLRLEITVAALSLEQAFNLAVHKMRRLLACELEVIAVRNEEYAKVSSEALRQCKLRVPQKKANKALTVEQVRLHATFTCLCTGHAWLHASFDGTWLFAPLTWPGVATQSAAPPGHVWPL